MLVRDPDRFEKVASGVQSVVLSLAITIGGAWTVYAFRSELQVANAKAQLEKLNRELAEQATIVVTLQVAPIYSTGHTDRYLNGTITFRNDGTADDTFAIAGDALKVARIKVTKDGQIEHVNVTNVAIRDADSIIVGITVLARSQNTLHFLARVADAGLYCVSINVSKSKQERKRSAVGEDTKIHADRDSWGDAAFISVD
jgi:hypothetical protein